MKRALLLIALLLPAALGAQQRDGFPHERHAKLFPTCTSCHGSTTDGGAMRSMPTPAMCANCHDGGTRRRVTWTPPLRETGLLVFSHSTHDEKAGVQAICQTCHATNGSTAWMAVGKALPATCVGCHAHQAPSHLADEAKCATCHRALVRATGLSDARIAALPRTAVHERPDFIATHGAAARASLATCATCHAQQSCARCHADAARSPTIQALAPDARVARLTANVPPRYPVPGDHQRGDFLAVHGPAATANSARCAVCHTRSSCATCHTGTTARTAIDALTADAEVPGRGVQLRRATQQSASGVTAAVSASAANAPATGVTSLPAPATGAAPADWKPAPHASDSTRRAVRVHATGFSNSHAAAAATEALTCSGCHAQRFCKDCHGAERSGARRYHPANFVARHAPESYGRETDCATCHNTQAFCRDCHRQSGLATNNARRGSGYHNGQPSWLLQHGRAARQELTSCATCHQQTYCLQCHSDAGWRVSPHGPDFNPSRMAARNRQLCLRCHLKDPLAGK